jgi:hypothetical protein
MIRNNFLGVLFVDGVSIRKKKKMTETLHHAEKLCYAQWCSFPSFFSRMDTSIHKQKNISFHKRSGSGTIIARTFLNKVPNTTARVLRWKRTKFCLVKLTVTFLYPTVLTSKIGAYLYYTCICNIAWILKLVWNLSLARSRALCYNHRL